MPDHSADSNLTIDDLDSNSGYKKSNGMSFGGAICLVVIWISTQNHLHNGPESSRLLKPIELLIKM